MRQRVVSQSILEKMSAPAPNLFSTAQPAQFVDVGDVQVPNHYGDALKEYNALRQSAGLFDLSFRSRICLLGADRKRFLHGQVTNNVKDLREGQGCYAALLNAKGKMLSDLFIYNLAQEILLDFEPGLGSKVAQRLEAYIIADDVQVADVAPHYGLLSLQGPKAAEILAAAQLGFPMPEQPRSFTGGTHADWGEVYVMNNARGAVAGFDLFVPSSALNNSAAYLEQLVLASGGCICGWQSLEWVRIEAGLPRFGVDMDETNLPPEAGIEARAISYSKGCYIGQEIISRIRTYGQVAKTLRGLRLTDDLQQLPSRGAKLFFDGKEVGHITSAIRSPGCQANIALGYVRREHNAAETELLLDTPEGKSPARIVSLPFYRPAQD